MAEQPTASQLNKLGDRLRKGTATADDVRVLNNFRESFRPAYEQVVSALESLNLEVGGRSAKTIGSIVAKVAREKTRLSTMQDIAGCRVEVPNRVEQDRIVGEIVKLFPESRIDDLRQTPSHGYRAVHVIVTVDARPVEIQVRTTLQNTWAQVTERFADRFEAAVKYGGGPESVRKILQESSDLLDQFEKLEKDLLNSGKLPTDYYDKLIDIKTTLQGLLRQLMVEDVSELEV